MAEHQVKMQNLKIKNKLQLRSRSALCDDRFLQQFEIKQNYHTMSVQ